MKPNKYNWDKLFGDLFLGSINADNYASFVQKKRGATKLGFFTTDLEAYIEDPSKKYCFAISWYTQQPISLASMSEEHKISLCEYLLSRTGHSKDSDQQLRELGVIE